MSEIQKLPTLQDLIVRHRDGVSVSDIIKFLDFSRFPYPTRYERPRIRKDFTAQDARSYAEQLENWETNEAKLKTEREAYYEQEQKIVVLLEGFIRYVTDFDENVPEKSRSKVWQRAYEVGHSSGWYSIYQELNSLVDLF